MTTFASGILYFVKHICILPFGHILMTFCARYIFMPAVQFEGRFIIVVELLNLPVVRFVAPQTIRRPVYIKLPEMIILVAVGANLQHSRKPLNLLSFRVLYKMTGPAALGCMRPRKHPTGRGMVEGHLAPRGWIVAALAR